MALAASAAVVVLLKNPDQNNVPKNLRTDSVYHLDPEQIENVLKWLWQNQKSLYENQLIKLVLEAQTRLNDFTKEK